MALRRGSRQWRRIGQDTAVFRAATVARLLRCKTRRSYETADDILRAAGTAANLDCAPITGSALLNEVVMPAVGQAKHAFSAALARINVEDLARSAAALQN